MPHTPSNASVAIKCFSTFVALVLVSGCATAPEPVATAPTPPDIAPRIASTTSSVPTDPKQLDIELNILFDWWRLLRSPALNSLVEKGFAAHPTVADAQAVLLKIQTHDIVRAGYFRPAVNISPAADGQDVLSLPADPIDQGTARPPGAAYYGLHTRQLELAYLPELLLTREATNGAAQPGQELPGLQMEATYHTLANNLIAGLLQEASLRNQMTSLRKLVAIDQSLLTISRKRLKAGLATPEELALRQAATARSEQALQRSKEQFELTRSLLRLLLALPIDAELPDTLALATLRPAQELPQEVAATLIEQRPDVRATHLHPAATEAHQNVSDIALKETENSLVAIYHDALALKAAETVAQERLAALETTRARHTSQTIHYQEVLLAEQSALLAGLRVMQARAQHLGDAIALYHALGGTWWDTAVALEISAELQQSRAHH